MINQTEHYVAVLSDSRLRVAKLCKAIKALDSKLDKNGIYNDHDNMVIKAIYALFRAEIVLMFVDSKLYHNLYVYLKFVIERHLREFENPHLKEINDRELSDLLDGLMSRFPNENDGDLLTSK